MSAVGCADGTRPSASSRWARRAPGGANSSPTMHTGMPAASMQVVDEVAPTHMAAGPSR